MENLDASKGKLTQICALSRLNDELSIFKIRKGKHVLTPPCKQLNPPQGIRCCTYCQFSIVIAMRGAFKDPLIH